MTRALLATTLLLAGCMSLQSARVLRPGKTRVSAGITRSSLYGDAFKSPVPYYLGELRVAVGVADAGEVGLQLARTAGGDQNVSVATLAPKVRLYESHGAAVSLALPAGVGWEEHTKDLSATFTVAPTLYVGIDLAPDTELVFAPRAGAAWERGVSGTVVGVGGSIGLALGDRTSAATFHPEIGFLAIQSSEVDDYSELLLTIGIGVTAGN